jgi:hypothetical protein
MKGISTVLRLHHALSVTSLCRLTLAVVMVLATLFTSAPVARADGPLQFVTSITLGFRAHDIIFDGDFAYVSTEKGLTILNITDLEHPVLVGPAIAEPSTKGNRSLGLAKRGNFVYLAAGKGGMQVIDVSDPANPQTIANAWVGGTIYDVAVHPNPAPGKEAAYAISYGGELYVWDISIPAAPKLKQTLGVMHWRGVCDICVQRMLDLSPSGGAQAVGVSAAGNTVSAVDWNYGGYYAWDSTDPHHLTFIGTHRAPVSFRAEVDLARDVAYVLGTYTKGSGVHSIRFSELASAPGHVTYEEYLQPAGTVRCTDCDFVRSAVDMDGGGIGFSSSGKYVFYAGGRGNGELAILDVSDPFNMVKVASVPLGPHYLKIAQGEGVVSRGDYLYVAASLLGIRVYKFPGLSTP